MSILLKTNLKMMYEKDKTNILEKKNNIQNDDFSAIQKCLFKITAINVNISKYILKYHMKYHNIFFHKKEKIYEESDYDVSSFGIITNPEDILQ